MDFLSWTIYVVVTGMAQVINKTLLINWNSVEYSEIMKTLWLWRLIPVLFSSAIFTLNRWLWLKLSKVSLCLRDPKNGSVASNEESLHCFVCLLISRHRDSPCKGPLKPAPLPHCTVLIRALSRIVYLFLHRVSFPNCRPPPFSLEIKGMQSIY